MTFEYRHIGSKVLPHMKNPERWERLPACRNTVYPERGPYKDGIFCARTLAVIVTGEPREDHYARFAALIETALDKCDVRAHLDGPRAVPLPELPAGPDFPEGRPARTILLVALHCAPEPAELNKLMGANVFISEGDETPEAWA